MLYSGKPAPSATTSKGYLNLANNPIFTIGSIVHPIGFNGYVDEFLLYNTVLSYTDVLYNYTSANEYTRNGLTGPTGITGPTGTAGPMGSVARIPQTNLDRFYSYNLGTYNGSATTNGTGILNTAGDKVPIYDASLIFDATATTPISTSIVKYGSASFLSKRDTTGATAKGIALRNFTIPTGGFTISSWFYQTDANEVNIFYASSVQDMTRSYTNSLSNQYDTINLYVTPNGTQLAISAVIYQTSYGYPTGSYLWTSYDVGAANYNGWHHISWSIAPASNGYPAYWIVLFDGIVISNDYAPINNSDTNNGYPTPGAKQYAYTAYNSNAYYDSFAFYTRALNVNEMYQLYLSNNQFNGVTGSTGITGPTGITGQTGVTGQTGITGPTGTDGMTGTTGQTGITGQPGVTGIGGSSGVTGNRGYTGMTGTRGETSHTGPTGQTRTGPTGITGFTGIQNSQSVTGISGNWGNTGTTGVSGPTGGTGVTGITGMTGRTGITGQIGAIGPIGQNATINMSSTGTTGITGPVGIQGPSVIYDGLTAPTGQVGNIGQTGNSSVTGYTGPTGYTGMYGYKGMDGFAGQQSDIAGSTGPTGAQIKGYTGYYGEVGNYGFAGTVGLNGVTGYTGGIGYTGINGMAGYTGYSMTGYTGGIGYTGSDETGVRVVPTVVSFEDDMTYTRQMLSRQMQENSYITDGTIDILAISRGYTQNETVYTFGKANKNPTYIAAVSTDASYGTLSSKNLRNWSPLKNQNANAPSRVVWDGIKWIVTRNDTSSILYSYNAETFIDISGAKLASIATNSKLYVGIGVGGVFYSYDGLNWINSSSGTSLISSITPIGKVVWNGSLWVAVGNGSAYTIIYSSDGINWSGVANSKTLFDIAGGAVELAWNGTVWVAVGANSTGKLVAISYNGTVWSNTNNLTL
jgi:hypothetical protein